MKRSTYKLLTKIPLYGAALKCSRKGEVMLCSQLLSDISERGINVADIFKLLEEKYPGEVVTNERFAEGCRELEAIGNKK